MADPYFFGYGSLVNTATHDYRDPHPARVTGWRRAWRHTDLRPAAFLTAIPDPASAIDGMIAHVPGDDWAALDAREWAYDRVGETPSVIHRTRRGIEIAMYAVPDARHTTPTERYPILMSYLDVVVQGYLRVYGAAGADGFFDSTDGWDIPILDDRAQPRYPRHQRLTSDETAFVDDRLRRLSAVIKELH